MARRRKVTIPDKKRIQQLERLNGIVRKNKNSIAYEKKKENNQKKKNRNTEFGTTTKSSIWTVRKK